MSEHELLLETKSDTKEEESKHLILTLDKLVREMPKSSYPGKYVWTMYNPDRAYMATLAKRYGKPEYYGLTIKENHIDRIESVIDTISTELIQYIEKNQFVVKRTFGNRNLNYLRFLTNRDFSNKPVMRFCGLDKFYSVFLNPGLFIPGKPTL